MNAIRRMKAAKAPRNVQPIPSPAASCGRSPGLGHSVGVHESVGRHDVVSAVVEFTAGDDTATVEETSGPDNVEETLCSRDAVAAAPEEVCCAVGDSPVDDADDMEADRAPVYKVRDKRLEVTFSAWILPNEE